MMKAATKQIQITFFTIAGLSLVALMFLKCDLEHKNERKRQDNQHMEAEVKKYIDNRIEEHFNSSTLEQRCGN